MALAWKSVVGEAWFCAAPTCRANDAPGAPHTTPEASFARSDGILAGLRDGAIEEPLYVLAVVGPPV
jgi:hypothetical protein